MFEDQHDDTQDAPADMLADGLPHFCDAALNDLRNHDLRAGSKLYQYALKIYLADSSPLLNRITSGIETGNTAQVRQASHSLKSNSLLVGALRVGHAAGIIEARTRLDEVLNISLARQLETLITHACQEISKRLQPPVIEE